MMNGNQGFKQQGVRPITPIKKKGYPPNEVLGVQIGHVGLVVHTDETGTAHENMVFFIGGKAYMDIKGGERWLREQLGVCQGEFGERLEAAYRRFLDAGETPTSDEPEIPASAVDVVPKPAGNPNSTKERLTSTLERGG